MAKADFLSHLEKRLSILKQRERADILAEYSQHIDIKMQSGLSEEEAIRDFGDVNELADEILDAYNVNPDYHKTRFNIESTAVQFFKKFGRILNAVADEIVKKNPRALLAIFVKLCIIGFCLFLAKIPLDWILDALRGILSFLPHFLTQMIMGVIALCFNILYLAVVLFTLYHFAKRMLIPNYFDAEEDPENGLDFAWEGHRDPHAADERDSGSPDDAETRSAMAAAAPNAAFVTEDTGRRRPRHPQAAAGKRRSEGEGSLLRVMTMMFAFVLKICLFFVLLPFVGLALAVIVGFGILVTLLLQGYPVVGLTLGALGGLLCLLSLIGIMMKSALLGGGKVS